MEAVHDIDKIVLIQIHTQENILKAAHISVADFLTRISFDFSEGLLEEEEVKD